MVLSTRRRVLFESPSALEPPPPLRPSSPRGHHPPWAFILRLAACCSFHHCRNHDFCSIHVACLIDTQAVSPPLRELTLLCLVNPVVVNLLLCVKPIFTGRLPSCAWKHTTGPLLDLGLKNRARGSRLVVHSKEAVCVLE